MEIEIVSGRFVDWMKEIELEQRYSEVTKKNYTMAENRFLEMNKFPEFLTQLSINRWLKMAMVKNNPLNYGFIKAYLRCYDPDNEAGFKIVRPRGRKYKPAKEYRFMNFSEVMQLIELLPEQLSLMVRLMFETGLRRFEVLNIIRKNIDFHDRMIVGMGKGNKEFKVHFSETTSELLQKWILHQDIDRPEKLFVFYSKNGNFIVKDQANKFWEQLGKEAEKVGFHKVHPHRIRHSLGRFLLSKGFNIELIRIKLRHESLSTTQIYTSATLDDVHKKEEAEIFKH